MGLKEATAERKLVNKKKRAKKVPKKKTKAKAKVKPPSTAPKGLTKIGSEQGISAGRPKGAKNRTTLVKEALKGGWDDLMIKKARDVFEKMVDMALDGDTQCIKMVMDRAVPVTKAVDINAADLTKTGGIVIHIEKLVTEPAKGQDIEDGVIIES